jgi:3-oxoacyl-[acyl-carrier protein] reductase
MAGAAPYATAKAAIHGLTRTLARELARENILSNVVMPGLTLTEANVERIPAAVRDELGSAGPLGRLLAPAEVPATIVFLASATNTAVVGEIVRASGGAS